jgi:hypothetical protein
MGKRQEEFMNAIKLLKEARDELGAVQYYIPPADETAEMTPAITADVDACQKLAERIDAALAEPAPDAMELVEKIRYPKYTQIDATTSSMTWFTDDQAAALIKSYGRRVPRAISDIAGKLEEAIDSEDWNEAKSALNDLWDLRDDGYKVEG